MNAFDHDKDDRFTGTAVIIGAGPAGLTAALELLRRTRIRPVVLEASDSIGGLARTVVYRGNRMDLGGHRFFSKSDRVTAWWLAEMPLAVAGEEHAMLLRPRRSRIYFLRQFFRYPLSLGADTLRRLGLGRSLGIAASYLRQQLRPRLPPKNLEDFFIQRFGRQLYRTFFQSYTEKVWGVPCRDLPASWGAQRVRGLSLLGAVRHQVRRLLGRSGTPVETSLCEQFLYPRLGPGQLWEHVAREVQRLGGEVRLNTTAERLTVQDGRVRCVGVVQAGGMRECIAADHVFSTMPVPQLLRALGNAVPPDVQSAAQGLRFRDFLTVGLVVRRFATERSLDDNWIYIQEPGIRMGRLQIFNNWSPALVANADTISLGLEYFCAEGDDLWTMTDEAMQRLGAQELERMGLLRAADVLDGHVVRVPRAYPAYHGSYGDFDLIRAYTDTIENLYPIGRNGMHRYNNQDHSMLAAMTVVDQLVAGHVDRDALWSINTEQTYHEQRQ